MRADKFNKVDVTVIQNWAQTEFVPELDVKSTLLLSKKDSELNLYFSVYFGLISPLTIYSLHM